MMPPSVGREQKPRFKVAAGCRASGAPVRDLLFLGSQPLANSLRDSAKQPELKVPLTLAFCAESSLVQIRETVEKELLFKDYVWVSGTAAATRAYAEEFARRAVTAAGLRRDDLIVEIGSNDGTFLKPFMSRGFGDVLGIDPASNIAAMANKRGVRTLNRFWDKEVAAEVASSHGKAKLLIARNVIPHASELRSVLEGVKVALADDGVGAFEFHYAGNILDGLQYDSIYHEHLCYFSLQSVSRLLERFGLFTFHIDYSPISGGALVVYFSKGRRAGTEALGVLKAREEELGINRIETWQAFARGCHEHRTKSLELLSSFSGRRIVGFGSSARSSTYLNFCGFDETRVEAIIDNNPLKQGKLAPGSSIPIVSLEDGLGRKPDLVFLLAWNFRDEVIELCRRNGYGGRFLVAFPGEPRLA